ncbi:hypothetical protein [Halomonas maura]|uniref:hypothetical protein n=1 Tax=Halomonas maura TaxID=117606 RepID=UPI0025B38EB8|nr:hypothetical protein [Halomonas maura]MDN3554700.1 hypothetical protein [Halomonas maura]
MSTYQFVRLQGYPRGSARRKGTLASVLAEGRRDPSHSRHVDSPAIEVTPIDTEWDSIREYQAWIETTMGKCVNRMNTRNGKVVERKIRSDAPALGTVIASLPSLTKDTPRETIDRFRKECADWFQDYLGKVGMRLNYCVLYLDKKYPHLHLWFTPGKEMLANKEWKMSVVTNPSLPVKENMRRGFFRDVGHKYFDELEKPKAERRRRIPSRAVAAENRLPQGEPNSEPPLMGMPVSRGSNADVGWDSNGVVAIDMEQNPFYLETIRRLVEIVLQRRHELGSLSQEQIIRMMVGRSGASEKCCQEVIKRMLEDFWADSEEQSDQPSRP